MEFGTYQTLLVEQQGNALLVTVNQPESLNALAAAVVEDLYTLTTVLGSIGTDAAWPVHGVIITGAGEKAFVAGANIVEMHSMDSDAAAAYGRRMHQVTLALEALPVPVIAAVNGFALGGGCELAMACDFLYASANASFGQPEVNLGLVPGFGGSVRLQRRVGIGMARELIYTGRRIKSAEALRIGLVNRVFEDIPALLDGAKNTIDEIAGKSPTAVANVKDAINEIAGLNTVDGLEAEVRSFMKAFATQDSVEGRSAFVAKRAPQFPGN
ncbi:enoyl-CoA hydratase [Arthrobacter sp. MYb227]|uniref:enoyl-CoA hydratase/isomerase family protein n=1 Tax=Arthrobacter sp. MYb227 TaxID=1848601 RepID=UPI000CFB1DF7|nr:enoyl-CoA hydratase-related protein [Arthrobacter sp. MYb227]PQZ90238.1 enoyl-CoA hydratase [Arthrobacter sp. MYb227]